MYTYELTARAHCGQEQRGIGRAQNKSHALRRLLQELEQGVLRLGGHGFRILQDIYFPVQFSRRDQHVLPQEADRLHAQGSLALPAYQPDVRAVALQHLPAGRAYTAGQGSVRGDDTGRGGQVIKQAQLSAVTVAVAVRRGKLLPGTVVAGDGGGQPAGYGVLSATLWAVQDVGVVQPIVPDIPEQPCKERAVACHAFIDRLFLCHALTAPH